VKSIIQKKSIKRNEAISMEFLPHVVSRERNKTRQTDVEFQDNFIYKAILITDTNSSDL
jgi:hypothetical protein